MIKHVNAELGPLRERRAVLEQHPQTVTDVLEHGNEQARKVAQTTMTEVRDAMHLEA
jgi:tryptophanyl-tRNA synthetase